MDKLAAPGIYRKGFLRLPAFLRRRIDPLGYEIEAFASQAATALVNGLVLDAGAGEARFSHLFAGRQYIALDLRIGDSSWDYSAIHLCADLAALPLADHSVERILNLQVLEHVEEPSEVLREFWRVLKPGGRLYLTVPQGWHEHQQPRDFFRFTRYSLESLLRKAGFKEIFIEPIGGYFWYLGQRMTYFPRVLFSGVRGAKRLLLLPLEIPVLALSCFAAPLACYYLDRLDRHKEFTLCYRCTAVK
jgi:SAM-dependent methyltransferase